MNKSTAYSYIRIYLALMHRDLLIFMHSYPDYFVNITLWIIFDVGVFAYIMPYFGLQGNFGTMILASVIASLGIFEAMYNAESFVADLDSERQITYDLALPIPSLVVFLQRASLYSTRMIFLSFFVLPIGKLLFWHKIDLSHFSLGYFLIVFVVAHCLYGFLALWLISFLKNIDSMRNIWIRLIMPLWVLGGYQFSWQAMHNIAPWLGYAMLANPIIYVTEAFRTAIMGQTGYINFWYCIMAMCIFSVFFAIRGTQLLKKRLDCL